MFYRIVLFEAALIAVMLALGGSPSAACPTPLPVSGVSVPELANFDARFTNLLETYAVPGGAVGVVKDGRLVYARGFGYADRDTCTPVAYDALFRIASLSKTITALTILQLVEKNLLDLDDPAFPLLTGITAPPGTTPDPRYQDITIRQLLWHAGGWNRDVSFDPMFYPVLAADELGETPPGDCATIIRWMLGYHALDFDPGTEYRYSNLGYCVLGRVIETVTGQPYETYVKNAVLRPLGIERMQIGHTLVAQRSPDEVRYHDQIGDPLCTSVFPGEPSPVPCPDGGWYQEALDSGGGWIASTTDLLRLVSAFDRHGPNPDLLPIGAMDLMLAPPPTPPVPPTPTPTVPPSALTVDDSVLQGLGLDAYYGMGWAVAVPIGGGAPVGWGHGGSLPGTTTYIARLTSGVSVVGLFNMRTPDLLAHVFDNLVAAASEVSTWPAHDLFSPLCGNGVTELGESCDDGNLVDGDGCSSFCQRMATAPVASASGFFEIDPMTHDACGMYAFDDATYDVFGTPINLGTAVGEMTFAGNADTPEVHSESTTPGVLGIDSTVEYVCHPDGCNSGGVNSDVGIVTAVTGSAAASLPAEMTFDGSFRFLVGNAVPQCLPGMDPVLLYDASFSLNTSRDVDVPLGSYMRVPAILEYSDSAIGSLRTLQVEVTFTSVESAGNLRINPYSGAAGELPANFITEIGGYRALFFDVSTTAAFSGPVTICGRYPDENDDGYIDGTSVPEGAIRILHRDGPTSFVDETSSLDPVNNVVCAEVNSLSPFALALYDGALATETAIGAKVLRIVDNDDLTKRRVVFVSKDPSVVMGDPGSTGDPRCSAAGGGGGSLHVFSTGESAQSVTFALPCENWSLIGPVGLPKGYRYRDKEQDQGPCKVVVVKKGKLAKAVCTAKNPASPIGYDLTAVGESGVAIRLNTGGTVSQCAELPGSAGTVRRDDATLFLAKDATAPSVCATP